MGECLGGAKKDITKSDVFFKWIVKLKKKKLYQTNKSMHKIKAIFLQ